MRIVRFVGPQQNSFSYKDQKISLSKLSEVRAKPTIQNHIIKRNNNQNLNMQNNKPLQSHIKWTPIQQTTLTIIVHDQNQVSIPTFSMISPKKTGRKKIFQKNQHSKQNIQIPTFSKMPQMNSPNSNDQQTRYYSMIHDNISPRQTLHNITGKQSIGSSNRQFRSPFKTNQQMSHYESQVKYQNSNTMMNSNTNIINSFEKSSLTQITDYHIPRLEQKLQQHDEQLQTIKKYLKNTQKLKNLNESIRQYQEIQSLAQKQKQIQMKKQYILSEIMRAKEMQRVSKMKMEQQSKQADRQVNRIQKERIRRLEKLQRQNQQLYSDYRSECIKQKSYQKRSQRNYDYKFEGPIAFPSNDWQSQRQIQNDTLQNQHLAYRSNPSLHNYKPSQSSQPTSNIIGITSNIRSSNNKASLNQPYPIHYQANNNKFKPYNTSTSGDMQISPILKRKMNQISLIGYSNNKTESFSMDANTFREILSPLEFQGDNGDTW